MSANSSPPDGSGADTAGAADLFGLTPSPYRDPRGRKKMRVTNDLRDRVATLRASGMTQQCIADAIGCSVPTLVEFFSFELNEGKAEKIAEAKLRLRELGMGGNVTALKAWIAMADGGVTPRDVVRPKAEPKLGKKEQALVDAKSKPSAGGWAAVVRH